MVIAFDMTKGADNCRHHFGYQLYWLDINTLSEMETACIEKQFTSIINLKYPIEQYV
jgi:hypothetical protein